MGHETISGSQYHSIGQPSLDQISPVLSECVILDVCGVFVGNIQQNPEHRETPRPPESEGPLQPGREEHVSTNTSADLKLSASRRSAAGLKG